MTFCLLQLKTQANAVYLLGAGEQNIKHPAVNFIPRNRRFEIVNEMLLIE